MWSRSFRVSEGCSQWAGVLFASSRHKQHEADRCGTTSKGVIPADTGAESPTPSPGRPTCDRSESNYESSGRSGKNTRENVGLLVLQTVLSTSMPELGVPQKGGRVRTPGVVCGSRRKVLNLLIDRSRQRNAGNDKGYGPRSLSRRFAQKRGASGRALPCRR